jgi:hypothetical protein
MQLELRKSVVALSLLGAIGMSASLSSATLAGGKEAMTEQDLKAVYRFVKSLGPAGREAPDYFPPTMTPPQPFVQFPSPPGAPQK